MHVSKPNWRVFVADWKTWQNQLASVRRQVFINEQGVPESLEWDGLDATARHVIALCQHQSPIGSARLLETGQIGRMAVLPDWRHKGIGQQLLKTTLETAKAQGIKSAFLHAQAQAASFYLPFGFEVQGESFMEAGILHLEMIRR